MKMADQYRSSQAIHIVAMSSGLHRLHQEALQLDRLNISDKGRSLVEAIYKNLHRDEVHEERMFL